MALKKRTRAMSATEMMNMNIKRFGFDNEWLSLFGDPGKGGCWLIWGESANGKTSFALQLAKYMTKFGRVYYNSIEQGFSASLQDAISREPELLRCKNLLFLDKLPMEEIEKKLQTKRGADIVFFDSLQYTGLTKITAKALIDKYPTKLFVFISHASGKQPDGRTASAVRYHAEVKIRVEGYKAKIDSRFGGDKKRMYTIWEEGAAEYWGQTN